MGQQVGWQEWQQPQQQQEKVTLPLLPLDMQHEVLPSFETHSPHANATHFRAVDQLPMCNQDRKDASHAQLTVHDQNIQAKQQQQHQRNNRQQQLPQSPPEQQL